MAQIDLIDEFKTNLQTRGLSNDTIVQYPKYILTLYAFVDGDLLGVNEEDLVRYLAHLRKKVKQTSIVRYFAVIGTFFDFLVFKKYITTSPVTPAFRKYYLRSYKSHDTTQRRQCISVQQAKILVQSILDPREKACVLLLLKTGVRRKELAELDLTDLDTENMTIHIRPTAKRSNETVYYDQETARVLDKWLKYREKMNKNKVAALFLDRFGNRLSSEAIYDIVTKHATAIGLNNFKSNRLEDHFSPHSCRHWFTTVLRDGGCPREYVEELRGDAGRSAIDIYYHIDKKKLQKAYLNCIPQLGIV